MKHGNLLPGVFREQEKLDVDEAVQEERETLEREFHERLRVILEDKERQHTEVLSAALARSEAALGEVARVKQVRIRGALRRLACGEGWSWIVSGGVELKVNARDGNDAQNSAQS